MNTRQHFHDLIDNIQDDKRLNSYYQLVKQLADTENGSLWNSLSANQKEELLQAYDESFDEVNLIDQSIVKELRK